MAGRYLSGEELRNQIKRHRELPQRGGLKEYKPDGSWLQNKRLESFYRERQDVLLEERVQKIGSLSVGEWIADQGRVLLVKNTGTLWNKMGHLENKKMWLFPEEALFLMDEGKMEVYHGGVPLSMEEGYSVLLGSKIPMEYYQAFSHLRRLGYIVHRHVKISRTTEYERLLGLHKSVGIEYGTVGKRKHRSSLDLCLASDKTMKSSKKLKFDLNAGNFDYDAVQDLGRDSLKCETASVSDDLHAINVHLAPDGAVSRGWFQTVIGLNRKADKQIGCEASSMINSHICLEVSREGILDKPSLATDSDSEKKDAADRDEENLHSKREILNLTHGTDNLTDDLATKEKSCKRHRWDFDKIRFPDMSKETSLKMVLTAPPPYLLPPGVELSKSSYVIDIKSYKQPTDEKVLANEKPISLNDFLSTANNSTEFKRQPKSSIEEIFLASSPAAVLWSGDVKPLIKPWHAVSAGSILSRLKITNNIDPVILIESADDHDHDIQIAYDVFQPDAEFRKSDPGTPAKFALCVARQESNMPSFFAFAKLLSETDTMLVWAVVDNGDVAFYSFNNVNLPTDIKSLL